MLGLLRTRLTRVAKQTGAVKASTNPLMQERGWTKTSRGWAGPIKTAHGQWPGIVELAGDRVKVYVRYLPAEIRQHAQGVGFHEQASGWFRIEFAVTPVDPDPNAVISHVERVIASAGDRMYGVQQELMAAA